MKTFFLHKGCLKININVQNTKNCENLSIPNFLFVCRRSNEHVDVIETKFLDSGCSICSETKNKNKVPTRC